jgi:eukaryotic-like serine/threonine-protein kinase
MLKHNLHDATLRDQGADDGSAQQRGAPQVPDFDLLRPIGSGGFGEVWLATNRTTGRLCAVKVIPLQSSGQAGDPAAREISSLTRLEANSRCRHPNLLQIHHVGKTATHLFYVMDPADDVSGEPASENPEYRPATLQTMLQNGPLAPELCLDCTRQLLAGLASLHAAGMVHRDVKPANCLFVSGQLKLGDFGLLTAAHPLVSRVGTQKYMPPDGRMDMRADVYAAGLVIYEMLSGLPVDEFPRLGSQSKRVGDSPALTALLRLVLQACERESEKRPADARAMLAELASPVGPDSRSPRRWLAAIGVIAVLAIMSASVWRYREGTGANSAATAEELVADSQKPAAAPLSQFVDVSFVTDPFEARIYLDGKLLHNPEGEPYTTPCTVKGLPARTCRIAFQINDEPPWEAEGGPLDLGRIQQIVSKRR